MKLNTTHSLGTAALRAAFPKQPSFNIPQPFASAVDMHFVFNNISTLCGQFLIKIKLSSPGSVLD
jgi:hypothetical protein